MQVIEDLLLESLQPHAHTHAAGAARAEDHVPLSELGPLAEEPRGFERRGESRSGLVLRVSSWFQSRSFAEFTLSESVGLRMTTL